MDIPYLKLIIITKWYKVAFRMAFLCSVNVNASLTGKKNPHNIRYRKIEELAERPFLPFAPVSPFSYAHWIP